MEEKFRPGIQKSSVHKGKDQVTGGKDFGHGLGIERKESVAAGEWESIHEGTAHRLKAIQK